MFVEMPWEHKRTLAVPLSQLKFVHGDEETRFYATYLMSELVVERLNRALGRPAVRRLRVQARKAPGSGR